MSYSIEHQFSIPNYGEYTICLHYRPYRSTPLDTTNALASMDFICRRSIRAFYIEPVPTLATLCGGDRQWFINSMEDCIRQTLSRRNPAWYARTSITVRQETGIPLTRPEHNIVIRRTASTETYYAGQEQNIPNSSGTTNIQPSNGLPQN